MAKNEQRAWIVPQGDTGEIDVEELQTSMLEAAAMVRRAGGAIMVQSRREPTNIEGVYLTTEATLIWSLHLPNTRRRRNGNGASPQHEADGAQGADGDLGLEDDSGAVPVSPEALAEFLEE